MKDQQKPMCLVCAWRSTCQKQFSLKAGQKCPDFVKDVTVKTEDNEEEREEKNK
ncbi:hypothetical protein [Thermodesulfovibrio sp.]|jgi:hypothetical protein|uniref:hypothetical protein n=1 Tax=Thermodesulfovibrio TaxID=28261 RepID=UPI00261ED242|nr:hypothetical protein [Thermodesulfovibrio sp.]